MPERQTINEAERNPPTRLRFVVHTRSKKTTRPNLGRSQNRDWHLAQPCMPPPPRGSFQSQIAPQPSEILYRERPGATPLMRKMSTRNEETGHVEHEKTRPFPKSSGGSFPLRKPLPARTETKNRQSCRLIRLRKKPRAESDPAKPRPVCSPAEALSPRPTRFNFPK